jgi:NifU-like protein involved in Fe-S cluster formation
VSLSCTMASPRSRTCCGSSRKISIVDFIERGLQRSRWQPYSVVGDVVKDSEARAVQFSLRLEDNFIESVAFRVSFCVTLIAYCELIAEWATGTTLQRAANIRLEDVATAFACVPPQKRDIAQLAKAAFSSAIRKAVEGELK